MSNYRRLISYIYAYEGGVKGKNIGFAKLETRNGQCRIQVSVRKVFLGSQDMGVFLLSTSSEIFLGRIFLRNGAGEFRTSVSVDHVAGTDQNIEQCYGLTIHSMDDSWQNYTTIWEDAVAHAAEVELEEAVSELAEEQEMRQVPESVISEKKLEEVVANHKASVVENIEAEIEAQNQQTKTDTASQDMEEEIPSTFIQPRKEEPQKLLWPREEKGTTENKTLEEQPLAEGRPQKERFEEQHQEIPSQGDAQPLSPQEQLEKELNEEELETPKVKSESQKREETIHPGQVQPQPYQKPFQGYFTRRPVHGLPQQEQYYQPYQPTLQQGIMSQQTILPREPQISQPIRMQQPSQSQSPQPMQQQPQSQPSQPMQQQPQGQPSQPMQQQPQGQPSQPMQQQPQSQPSQPMQQQPQGQLSQPLPQLPQEPLFQPIGQRPSWRQQSDQPEKEETKEGVNMETLWQQFCKAYPKIKAFDYDGNCEILTIKPQDIGLLPREIWTYGNNSFLLHGYYNHHYLILARLTTPNGGVRFLLGVPGHYYSSEKYMASMFGFPNFVKSKTQPSDDNRFGYWYTDLRLGF